MLTSTLCEYAILPFIFCYYNLRKIMLSITPYEPLSGLSLLPVILLKIWEKI